MAALSVIAKNSFFSEPHDFVEQPAQFLSFFGSRKSFFAFFNPAFGIDLPDVSRLGLDFLFLFFHSNFLMMFNIS